MLLAPEERIEMNSASPVGKAANGWCLLPKDMAMPPETKTDLWIKAIQIPYKIWIYEPFQFPISGDGKLDPVAHFRPKSLVPARYFNTCIPAAQW